MPVQKPKFSQTGIAYRHGVERIWEPSTWNTSLGWNDGAAAHLEQGGTLWNIHQTAMIHSVRTWLRQTQKSKTRKPQKKSGTLQWVFWRSLRIWRPFIAKSKGKVTLRRNRDM